LQSSEVVSESQPAESTADNGDRPQRSSSSSDSGSHGTRE